MISEREEGRVCCKQCSKEKRGYSRGTTQTKILRKEKTQENQSKKAEAIVGAAAGTAERDRQYSGPLPFERGHQERA